MADFPTDLTNAVDNTTDIKAKHLNNLEAKVGIDGSTVTTSHAYKLSGVTGTDKAVSKTGTETLTNKTIGISNLISFKAPEGFLINGKIVPSVASGNLIVAIKGLDGNDPSATNPVYVRIGDAVHSITSALSVPANAGTNWFNAGSSELATKEIDYFVYLGYNATDGVVIGFSRIPYATEYSQFSTTSTNEKYCAISNIAHATSGDDYVVIGRFAATLSGGTGYTWSVPAFDNKNLIQRPIFETRVLTWQPTYTCSGSMVYTNVSDYMGTRSGYKLIGSHMYIHLCTYGTTGGSASNTIFATIPFNTGLDYQVLSGCLNDGGSYQTAYVSIGNDNKISCCHYILSSNWGLGEPREMMINGVIELTC